VPPPAAGRSREQVQARQRAHPCSSTSPIPPKACGFAPSAHGGREAQTTGAVAPRFGASEAFGGASQTGLGDARAPVDVVAASRSHFDVTEVTSDSAGRHCPLLRRSRPLSACWLALRLSRALMRSFPAEENDTRPFGERSEAPPHGVGRAAEERVSARCVVHRRW